MGDGIVYDKDGNKIYKYSAGSRETCGNIESGSIEDFLQKQVCK